MSTQQTIRPTHLTTINSSSRLEDFVSELEQEFSLTDFNLLKTALNSGIYSLNFNAEIEEEKSYDAVSKQYVSATLTPTNNPSLTNRFIHWEWETTSGHYLCLDGEIKIETQHGDNPCEISLYIGTDESSCFYPTILQIIRGLGLPIS